MWREAGLEEPGASAANGGGIDRNVDVAEADIDNLNAGGFFARYGREPNGPRAQRSSRRTPLEGNHRGHRVATRQGGRAARGVRGGSGEIVIEVGGGLQSGLSNHSCLYSVNKNRQLICGQVAWAT